MTNITNKTKRTELIERIENQKITIDNQGTAINVLEDKLLAARVALANANRTIEIRDTDIHNLLGTIRVMADSSREVRIRASTVRDAGLAVAMPVRNTD